MQNKIKSLTKTIEAIEYKVSITIEDNQYTINRSSNKSCNMLINPEHKKEENPEYKYW